MVWEVRNTMLQRYININDSARLSYLDLNMKLKLFWLFFIGLTSFYLDLLAYLDYIIFDTFYIIKLFIVRAKPFGKIINQSLYLSYQS